MPQTFLTKTPFSAVFTIPANGNVIFYLALTPHIQSVTKSHQLYLQNAPPIPPLLPLSSAAALVHMPPSVLLMMVFTGSQLMLLLLPHIAARMILLCIRGVRLWHSFSQKPTKNSHLVSNEWKPKS